MDSRLDPLRMLGIDAGDFKILLNAEAWVTEDVLRTLVPARYLLGSRASWWCITPPARWRAARSAVHRRICEAGGPDARSISFLTTR